jgi:phosphotransferase system enzyme I (PtsI)
MIKNIVDSAHKAGIWVGMCGEMAGDPVFSLIILGLGLDELSMPPLVVPQIKQVIRSSNLAEAKEIAKQALLLSTGKEVLEFSKKYLGSVGLKGLLD